MTPCTELAGSCLCSGVELHGNLDARFRLLASLHWSLPQCMSAAEAAFSAQDLPTLQRIATDLKRKCQARGLMPMAVVVLPRHSEDVSSKPTLD